jgi:cupin fold WbuC family metalloprotein
MNTGTLSWRVTGNDSYYAYLHESQINQRHIEELKSKGRESKTGRARLCLHKSPDSKFQLMIIYHDDRTTVEPHRHLTCGEYVMAYEGSMEVNFFDDDLTMTKKFILEQSANSLPLWVPANLWHCMKFTAETIFYEFSEGPFDAKITQHADSVK